MSADCDSICTVYNNFSNNLHLNNNITVKNGLELLKSFRKTIKTDYGYYSNGIIHIVDDRGVKDIKGSYCMHLGSVEKCATHDEKLIYGNLKAKVDLTYDKRCRFNTIMYSPNMRPKCFYCKDVPKGFKTENYLYSINKAYINQTVVDYDKLISSCEPVNCRITVENGLNCIVKSKVSYNVEQSPNNNYSISIVGGVMKKVKVLCNGTYIFSVEFKDKRIDYLQLCEFNTIDLIYNATYHFSDMVYTNEFNGSMLCNCSGELQMKRIEKKFVQKVQASITDLIILITASKIVIISIIVLYFNPVKIRIVKESFYS